MAILKRLILLATFLVLSHAWDNISQVTNNELAIDITEHDCNDGGAPKNDPWVMTTQQNSLDLIQNNYADNTNPARNDGMLQNEPTMAMAQENSLDLTHNNIGDNRNPAMNDDELLENEPMLPIAQHNSLDLTQNNNGDNTCPARNDEEVMENEQTMTTTQLNLWNLANNNGDHTSPVLNNNNRESPPWITLVTRYIVTTLNSIRQYHETTLPRYMIGANAMSQVPGEFPRPQVVLEFPGHHQTLHVAQVPQYKTASLREISRTASHLRIHTQHKAARATVGKLLFWWGNSVLLSGFVSTLQTIDILFIITILFFEYIHFNWRINKLFFAMTCVISGVLSTIRLASQHFGEAEEAYKVARSIAFNVFYVIALTDALVNFALIAY